MSIPYSAGSEKICCVWLKALQYRSRTRWGVGETNISLLDYQLMQEVVTEKRFLLASISRYPTILYLSCAPSRRTADAAT